MVAIVYVIHDDQDNENSWITLSNGPVFNNPIYESRWGFFV